MNKPFLLLVDVGVGRAVEQWLRDAGYDIQAVREVDPRLSDTEILAWAVREQVWFLPWTRTLANWSIIRTSRMQEYRCCALTMPPAPKRSESCKRCLLATGTN